MRSVTIFPALSETDIKKLLPPLALHGLNGSQHPVMRDIRTDN